VIFRLCIRPVIGALFTLVTGCETSKSASGHNISSLYIIDKADKIDVQYYISQITSSRVRVRWTISNSSIEAESDEFGEEMANLVFSYKIFQNYSTSISIDSGRLILKDFHVFEDTPLKGQIEFDLESSRNHLIEITLRDLNAVKYDRQYLNLIKSKQFSNQSFEVFSSKETLQINQYVTSADSYLIKTAQPQSNVYARFYDRDFPIASPPFAVVNPKQFDFKPDKFFQLRKVNSSEFKLYLTQKGFYQIVVDSASKQGGSLYYFGDHYPNAKTVNDLLMPLRYITTQEEFAGMSGLDNIKKNIDAYWLRVGGGPERARQLLQAYYLRVETANRLFSSYLEGWKSDRGMCLIVFGPPTAVYRSTASETWFYGEKGKFNTVQLSFTKVVNPFSSNDFRLNRNGALKSPWYRAVEFWRQGRIITY
jgi:GWxTD domain-containing protein